MYIVAHNGARIFGGAERATSRLLAGLQRRGHRVLLLCNRPVVAEGAVGHGVPVERLPLGGDIALPHALRLAGHLHADRPDAFIVGTWKKLFLASLGARLAGVRRVVARIGLETDTPRSWKYRYALRNWVDDVVVVARRMAEPFATFPGFDPARVHVVANGIVLPPEATLRARAREILDIPPHARVVGAVARLDSQKRLDRLIGAVERLPDSYCVIAGDGPERPALEMLANRPGLRERVIFLGHREDTATILAALDLFVLTSDREGMSNAMLEALAAGVPVVSTPVSGADDALEPFSDGREPGRVIPDFSDRALHATLAALLADPEQLAAMSQSARARAAESFDFERMLDRWEAVLSA